MEIKGFNRRDFLKMVGTGAASMALQGCQTNRLPLSWNVSKNRPNILVIYTDDQSYRTINCHPRGHTWVKTPNIDRLAQEGLQFTAGYCGAWCMPARVSFLTGLQTHGVQGLTMSGSYPHSEYDPSICRFWPSEFRKTAGYTTAFIGKWHISEDAGHGRDWDHSVVWNHAVPEKAGHYYRNQKLSFDGGPYKAVGGYSTDNYTDYALNFINRNHQKPWFLWLCYDAVHGPNIPGDTPAERHKGAYNEVYPVPMPVDLEPPRPNKPEYAKHWKNRPAPALPREYNEGVLAIDEGVGRILKALKQQGQLDNTLIVFTSDQGLALGHHGFFWKVAPYDDNILAPFIIRMPGMVPEGKVCHYPVSQLDLIPTFFRLAGAPLPWKMHGHDMTKILRNPEAKWEYPLLMEYFGTRYGSQTDKGKGTVENGDLMLLGDNIPVPWWLSIQQGHYKYIRNLTDNEIEELYDLKADPLELNNLAVNPSYKKVLTDYRHRLINELKRTDAGLIENMPEPRIAY